MTIILISFKGLLCPELQMILLLMHTHNSPKETEREREKSACNICLCGLFQIKPNTHICRQSQQINAFYAMKWCSGLTNTHRVWQLVIVKETESSEKDYLSDFTKTRQQDGRLVWIADNRKLQISNSYISYKKHSNTLSAAVNLHHASCSSVFSVCWPRTSAKSDGHFTAADQQDCAQERSSLYPFPKVCYVY